jgi:hypothetical protein
MYKEIIIDIFKGLFNSLRFDLFIKPITNNIKLQKLFMRVLKYNFITRIVPQMITFLIYYIFGLSLYSLLNIINYPISLLTLIFHLVHYLEIINIVSPYASKTGQEMPFIDGITIGITMSIYGTVIYLATELIRFVFHDRLYFIAIILNFFILTIYHSFYCYNNLWQFHKINMNKRIDIHEKLWPYYFGYGIISTIIYLYSANHYMMLLYNLYLFLIISVPFLTELRFPTKVSPYPKINLTIFSYMTGYVFNMSRKIINYVTKSDK